MRIWIRYLLAELAAPLGLWLAFSFLLLFVLQFLRGTDVLLGSAVTAPDIARLIAYLAPHFLVMALPVAFLLSILLSMGRLSEDRELLSLTALGLGPVRLVLVPTAVGAVLGAVVLLLAFTAEPWGLARVRSEASELIKKNVVRDVKSGLFYEDLSQLTVYAEEVKQEEGRWTNVMIYDDRDPAAPLLVLARKGQVVPGEGAGLQLSLTDGRIDRPVRSSADYAVVRFQQGEIAVGLEETLFRKGRRFRSTREELTPTQMLEVAHELEISGGDPMPYRLGFHWRLAQVLSPVAFALWATPLSLRLRRGGRGRAMLFTLLGYISYYVLWRAFENMALRERIMPVIAAQLPNAVFIALGVWALYRMNRPGAVAR